MLKFIKILPVLLLGIPAFVCAQESAAAQKVLDKLYKQNGNKIILKPKVVITNDDRNAALYRRTKNSIEISEKLLQACRKYGKDSSSALAFVLGHELSHAFQKDLKAKETSFLAYSSAENSSISHEEEADVSGGFLAYLANYKTLEIIEPLIEDIYKEFDLEEKLYGYPSLEERKKTAAKVKRMIEELIHVYEAGNYFTAIGKYQLAVYCYEFINKWYKGREIYNNLGVNYAYLALNFTSKNADAFVYPLELEWNTRLKKPSLARGDLLSKPEMLLRQEYLSNSEKNLIEASVIDPEMFTTNLNIMTVFVLKGQFLEALDYYRTNELIKKSNLFVADNKEKEQLRLILALAYEGAGQKDNSKKIWNDISQTSSSVFAEQAAYNLKVMDNLPVNPSQESCFKFPEASKTIDGVRLQKWQPQEKYITLNEKEKIEISIIKLSQSTIYSVKTPTYKLNMQRIYGSWKVKNSNLKKVRSNLLITGGSVYHCEMDRYAVLIDAKNVVTEYVKY
ncbi:MAG: M48 family metalloprotease [Saprospiraceae bacterium]|nr:M48 family metalloprotease [Saprospiraceae bacterium]